jgi:hypothetical protein
MQLEKPQPSSSRLDMPPKTRNTNRKRDNSTLTRKRRRKKRRKKRKKRRRKLFVLDVELFMQTGN